MKVELTDEEMQFLNVLLGETTGAAIKQGMHGLAMQLVKLTNIVNRDNPNFTPYGIENQENANAASH